MPLLNWFRGHFLSTQPPPAAEAQVARQPTPRLQVAFAAQPSEFAPNWTDVSSRLRQLESQRGRAYEYDRMETGSYGAVLDDRDSALSPANSSSPYAPIRSTRGVKATFNWANVSYPHFRGISEGYPQSFPSQGYDAQVAFKANDLFYALNNARFALGSTTLAAQLAFNGTETQMSVASTALPMPQNPPFTVRVAGGGTVLPFGDPYTYQQAQEVDGTEDVTVTEIVDASTYLITRSANGPSHAAGNRVEAQVVSFGEELSGTRIRNVLDAIGIGSEWYDLDGGLSPMAATDDLLTTNPLEHINLIVEAEFGRFFVSRSGIYTFRDRNSVYVNHLTADITFAQSSVPYALSGPLEHSEDKLFNRVKITIPSGEVVDLADEDSIAQHYERVFEKSWPYASVNDADSAARYILARNSEVTLRLPRIDVFGMRDPNTLWPLLLAREIGDRARFRYQPRGGGDEIDKQVTIDAISHSAEGGKHVVSFDCTEADANQYWIIGVAGYGEIGQTTVIGF